MFTPLTIKGTAAILHLTRGLRATIDVVDWPLVGSRRWRMHTDGYNLYAVASVPGQPRKYEFLHRVILPGVGQVDHKDRNGLNNRRGNLRPADHAQNAANRRGTTGFLGYRGVFRTPDGGYIGKCRWRGKFHSTTRHSTAEDAARAYDVMAVSLYGEFAQLNFPNPVGSGS